MLGKIAMGPWEGSVGFTSGPEEAIIPYALQASLCRRLFTSSGAMPASRITDPVCLVESIVL